jgi:hypothetical protein
VKALAISLVTGVALCGIMSAPAAAMPMSNVAAAATDPSWAKAYAMCAVSTDAGGGRITITAMHPATTPGTATHRATADSGGRRQPAR